MSTPRGRCYRMLGGDGERPANWLVLRSLDGRRVGTFMDVATVERFAELHPGVTFKVVSWLSGRVNGRFLVRGNWSRQVRWAEEKRP